MVQHLEILSFLCNVITSGLIICLSLADGLNNLSFNYSERVYTYDFLVHQLTSQFPCDTAVEKDAMLSCVFFGCFVVKLIDCNYRFILAGSESNSITRKFYCSGSSTHMNGITRSKVLLWQAWHSSQIMVVFFTPCCWITFLWVV